MTEEIELKDERQKWKIKDKIKHRNIGIFFKNGYCGWIDAVR